MVKVTYQRDHCGIHYGKAITRHVASAMYIQLYRSKVQFYRKFGGERRAARFKWLVRLAYWPRLAAAEVGVLFSSSLAARAATYRRLLAELAAM